MTNDKCCENVCVTLKDMYTKALNEYEELAYNREKAIASQERLKETFAQHNLLQDMIIELTTRDVCKCIDMKNSYLGSYARDLKDAELDKYRNAPKFRKEHRSGIDEEIKDIRKAIRILDKKK